jgi:hypothetical protein
VAADAGGGSCCGREGLGPGGGQGRWGGWGVGGGRIEGGGGVGGQDA